VRHVLWLIQNVLSIIIKTQMSHVTCDNDRSVIENDVDPIHESMITKRAW